MESFKQTEEGKKEAEVPKKKFVHLLDEEQVEIKRLTSEDIEECVSVMRKCAFDVTELEVGNIVAYGNSFAATVNRLIVGVGLAWPAKYDLEHKRLVGGTANSLYLEDPAVLLAYEGRGIRRILVTEREREARDTNLVFAIAYLSEDTPREKVEEHIMESGNALEKLYLSEGYTFHRTDRGILAVKKVIEDNKDKSAKNELKEKEK